MWFREGVVRSMRSVRIARLYGASHRELLIEKAARFIAFLTNLLHCVTLLRFAVHGGTAMWGLLVLR